MLQIFILFKKTDCVSACRHKMRTTVKRFLNTLKLNIVLPDMNPGASESIFIFITFIYSYFYVHHLRCPELLVQGYSG